MENKHSRGPWVTDAKNLGTPWNIDTVDGEPVALAAQVVGDTKHKRRTANAKLLAAAPELLDACRSALKVIEENIPVTAKVSVAGIARILRATIAKAEGRDG